MKDGRLVALTSATVVVLFLVLAALHDISRAESDLRLEYTALGLGIPALALIYRRAFQLLAHKGKVIWLASTAVLLLLFNASSLSAWLNPKYANDAAVGTAFLAVGLPLLVFDLFRLVRLTSAPR